MFVKYEELYDYLTSNDKPKSNQCVAEFFEEDRPYRMFFDVEIPKKMKNPPETIDVDKLKDKICEVMNRITRTHSGSIF
jgi:hypothetical protein